MKPPAMCPDCERAFVRTLLAEGPTAARNAQGSEPCAHVVTIMGVTLVPDPSWPEGIVAQWHPSTVVVDAYRDGH